MGDQGWRVLAVKRGAKVGAEGAAARGAKAPNAGNQKGKGGLLALGALGGGPPGGGGGGGGQTTTEQRDEMKALQKLTLQNSAAIRDLHTDVGDFWLIALNNDAVQSSLETGREYGRKTKEHGKGHKLGPPHGHVAASFVDGLITLMKNDVDLPEMMKQVLTTLQEFIANIEGQWGLKVITEIFKQFKVQATHQDDAEMEDSERLAKVTFVVNTCPCFRAALFKDQLEEGKMQALLGFQAVMFKQAINAALAYQGGIKSRSGGTKRGLERAIERQLNRRR